MPSTSAGHPFVERLARERLIAILPAPDAVRFGAVASALSSSAVAGAGAAR